MPTSNECRSHLIWWMILPLSIIPVLGQEVPATKASAPPISTIRIWVSEKETASMQGGFSSADLLKEVSSQCVGVALTDDREKGDYRLEAGRAWCCTSNGQSRGFKFALFNKDGDAVASTKTHELKNAVKDMCGAIGRAKMK